MEKIAEVYSVNFDVRAQALDAEFIKTVLQSLVERIAGKIERRESALIGHIKGFCEGDGVDYFQVNCTSSRQGAMASGQWRGRPKGARLALNVIALNLTWRDLFQMTQIAASETEGVFPINLTPELSAYDKEKSC